MFVLGHVGIGTHLVPGRVRRRLPWAWLAVGCLLPDLIDKPVWLALRLSAVEPGPFANARLLGHTVFLAGALALAAALGRAPALRALAWGVPTHLFLDAVTDFGLGGHGVWRTWLFWPWRLPQLTATVSVPSLIEPFSAEASSRVYVAGEVIGAALLLWDAWRSRSPRPP